MAGMSKHLLSFLLSELTIVRVVCQKCKSVVELPIGNLGTRFGDATCRICKREFTSPEKVKALLALDLAIAAIQEFKDNVELEFVIPMKGE